MMMNVIIYSGPCADIHTQQLWIINHSITQRDKASKGTARLLLERVGDTSS